MNASQTVEIEVPFQLPLEPESEPPSFDTPTGLTLADALPQFLESLKGKDAAENTIKAFAHDIGLLGDYFRWQTQVRRVRLEDLESFLHWLEYDRGVNCSKKTLSRRIASLRGFFRWLQDAGHIDDDPAASLKQVQPEPYLPQVLDMRQVRSLYSAASDIYWRLEDPDPRPLLLLSLLLETGMKKQECLRLRVGDFNSAERTVTVGRGSANKERSLTLNPLTWTYFEEYCQRSGLGSDSDAPIFDCTARNLEYVLENLGRNAGIESCKVGFEVLRWTSAVNDFRLAMPDDELRRKLGLSRISWRETRSRLESVL